eukprot:9279431-Pyramimonas_sp.AAC.1
MGAWHQYQQGWQKVRTVGPKRPGIPGGWPKESTAALSVAPVSNGARRMGRVARGGSEVGRR